MKNEILAPDFPNADFVMVCVGDSMINARIFDGDIVYIRQQDTVENGEIAAVVIDGVATLGGVWKHPDGLALVPENPKYATRVFLRGRAVAGSDHRQSCGVHLHAA